MPSCTPSTPAGASPARGPPGRPAHGSSPPQLRAPVPMGSGGLLDPPPVGLVTTALGSCSPGVWGPPGPSACGAHHHSSGPRFPWGLGASWTPPPEGLITRAPGPGSPGVLRMLFLSAVPSTPSSSRPGACCCGHVPVKASVWERPLGGAGRGGRPPKHTHHQPDLGPGEAMPAGRTPCRLPPEHRPRPAVPRVGRPGHSHDEEGHQVHSNPGGEEPLDTLVKLLQ